MMTNREKYINNADDVALYNLLDWNKIENKFGIKINGTNDIYKWLSEEVVITADDMFEELGYKPKWYKTKDDDYSYWNSNGYEIIISIKDNKFIYTKLNFNPYDNEVLGYYITEDENKAIYKKIEELKLNKNETIWKNCRRCNREFYNGL